MRGSAVSFGSKAALCAESQGQPCGSSLGALGDAPKAPHTAGSSPNPPLSDLLTPVRSGALAGRNSACFIAIPKYNYLEGTATVSPCYTFHLHR